MADLQLKHSVEDKRTLILEREFSAPRRLVFKAFGDCRHLRHWWSPAGFELTHCDLDFRPGGSWHYCMTGVSEELGEMKGMESWGLANYSQISEPELIAYRDYFADAEARINEDMPASDTVVTLVEVGDRTLLVNRTTYASEEALQQVIDMGMIGGVDETWNKLEEHLQDLQRG